MALQSAADIPVQISSANSTSERRVSPSWSIAHFKARLEPITGIPASSQQLTLRSGSRNVGSIRAPAGTDEADVQLASFSLQPYAEVLVTDTRPPAMRQDYTDVSAVPKYTMPEAEYASRSDSVLAWKKAQGLGRFDPDAPGLEQQKVRVLEREVSERGIAVGLRCQLLPAGTDGRRGAVAFVGPVEQIPGPLGPWIGVVLDEPAGKNDGSVAGARYFDCPPRHGVFVRPERVEVGDFPALDDLGEDMEEI